MNQPNSKAQEMSRRTARTAGPATMTLEQLDRRLDVPTAKWDKTVKRLAREFKTKGYRLDVPTAVSLGSVVGEGVSWSRLYSQQVRRLPKMDRADEFRMARRYEFVRLRLRVALSKLGLSEEEIDKRLFSAERDLAIGDSAAGVELSAARADFEALRNLYMEHALHLVFSKVHRYRNLGVDTSDLIQEANASLFHAIEGFDWRRNVRFNTYAQYWIHQAILKNLYDASRTVRLPVWIQKAYRKIQRFREADRDVRGDFPPSEVVAAQFDMPAARVDEILKARRGAVSLDRVMFDDSETTLAQSVPDDQILPIEERVQDGDLRASLAEAMDGLPPRERSILERRFGIGRDGTETLSEIAADLGISSERVRQLQNAALARLRKPDVKRVLRTFA